MKKDKIFIHFDNDLTNVYIFNNSLNKFKEYNIFFNETYVNDELFNKIDDIINNIKNEEIIINNETTRIFATGIFQDFSAEEKQQIIIHVYVKFGLFINIISHDLEEFYLSKSKNKNIIEGLLKQEFRSVVICGSFQQYMKEINDIMKTMKKYNIRVLSPWTNNIVKETLGTDFILLEGQVLENERDAWRHKLDHMNKFRNADAIIVCDPNGFVGKGTMFEFGYMIAYSKRIIFMEKPKDLSILFPYEIGLDFN